MALLNRNQILEAKDIKTEIVDVPEWGGSVMVKLLTGKERDEFEASSLDSKNNFKKDNIRAKMVLKCAINEDFTPMFSPADLDSLGAKSSVALDRVFWAAMKLNKMGQTEIDELVKN